MSFRRNPITGDPILFAPERAARPNAFGTGEGGTCPFCPGNEHETPPELERIAAEDGSWLARAFPNKYPAAARHEVVVESRDHAVSFGELAEPAAIVEFWLDRLRRHLSTSVHATLFKNHGARAGASLTHIHSQIIPLPFFPPRAARERDAFLRYEACPLCDLLTASERDPSLVIAETEEFVWLAPQASQFAHEQWLVPRTHAADPRQLTTRPIDELASLLARSSRASLSVGDAYNWLLMVFPGVPQAHYYFDLVPRLTTLAGFELGGGTFIGMVDPAETAARFRSF